VLNSTFCEAQPSVLKASVSPTAVSPDLVVFCTTASICDVFCASSRTLPSRSVSAPSASRTVISLSTAYALALLSTTFVAIVPLTATTLPVPYALPPEAIAVLSAVASIVAFSIASSVRSPDATVTSALSI